MPHDHPNQITLSIAGHPQDLQVVALQGQETLNAPWRYVIELLSSDPCLDTCALTGHRACLKPTAQHPGIHGLVTEAHQVYAGASLSHYRISLEPCLQRLAGAPRQRLFVNRSVPQIISTVLSEHNLTDFRFEHLHGVYPPRQQCVQHHENDLQLLQRLCAEEGIHFRFESRYLVFCDDPAGFPERPDPLLFRDCLDAAGLLDHLDKPLRLHPLPSGREPQVQASTPEWAAAPGQSETPPAQAQTGNAAWQQQRCLRRLERQRGEARLISGRSREKTLHSGQVVRISGHPEPQFNDHWLLIRVEHFMHQLAALEGHDPWDIAAIVDNLGACPQSCVNHFQAIPWTLPYRPAAPLRVLCSGLQAATLVHLGSQGQLAVRFDWQSPTEVPAQAMLLPERLPTRPVLQPGSRVLLAFLDDDPDRPVICALQDHPDNDAGLCLWLDGKALDIHSTSQFAAGQGQHLHLSSQQPLTLKGPAGSLRIEPQTITASSHQALQLTQRIPRNLLQDLQELGLETTDNTPWYLVRMIEAGLEHLSRLDPQDILLEGHTDAQGRLGLSHGQLQQLAIEYARTPHQLCLIHPGHCIPLREHLGLDDEQRHQALLAMAGSTALE